MTAIPTKDLQRIVKLYRVVNSLATAGERTNAWTALNELLSKYRRSWNDLLDLIVEAAQAEKTAHGPAKDDEGSDDVNETSGERAPPALDLVHRILEHYVALESHEYVAVALWILHAHIYDQFMHSPRLALTSPVRGCGKTILLSIIEKLVPRPHRTDSITPAAIFRLIDRDHSTMLIDEADNAGLLVNGDLRAVINAGHRKGGGRSVSHQDGVRTYRLYGPMAIAAIGTLPLPISHRSILIHMTRYAGDPLRRFDDSDTVELDYIHQQVWQWKKNLKINADPAMPEVLQNRQADNWRPLIAIADGFGAGWGRAARDAALAFARGYRDEDIGVVLLRDIRDLFNIHSVDRFHSAHLVAALNDVDGAPWAEWRGVRDDQSPRRFSQGELAKLLAPFLIQPRTVWPLRRSGAGKSGKGYLRAQFVTAWASYCEENGTAAHTRKNKHLASKLVGTE